MKGLRTCKFIVKYKYIDKSIFLFSFSLGNKTQRATVASLRSAASCILYDIGLYKRECWSVDYMCLLMFKRTYDFKLIIPVFFTSMDFLFLLKLDKIKELTWSIKYGDVLPAVHTVSKQK